MYTTVYPPMNAEERAQLEKEAGHPFLRDEDAYKFRLRQLSNQAVENLLHEKENHD